MRSRIKWPLLDLSIMERLVVVGIALGVSSLLLWTFARLGRCWVGVAVWLILTASAKTRAGFTVCALLSSAWLTMTGWETWRAVRARPLPTVIHGTRFDQTPLPEALYYLAVQKRDWPRWTFHIDQRELMDATVTVSLPDRCTLEEALGRVCQAAGAQYSWHWWKSGGNAPEPLSAKFLIRRAGSSTESRTGTDRVSIYEDHIHYAPAWRSNATWVQPALPVRRVADAPR
jgi:hypothetical protein